MDKIKKSAKIYLFFGIVSFVFLLLSSIHPWNNGVSYTDSSVFQTVAFMMKRGAKPYADTFDHKGPLLYLINGLGDAIWGRRGIWAIEFICMFLSCCLLFHLSGKIQRSSVYAVISVLFAISTLFEDFEGGNLTEEYSIPLITLSLYFFMDHFLNGKCSRIRWGIIGFCFGCVLLLRVNNAVLWGVFCPIVFIEAVRKRTYRKLLEGCLCFLAGMGIAMIPILFLLHKIDALRACWEDYILFNLFYTGVNPLAKKWETFFVFLNHPAVILSYLILFLLYARKREKRTLYSFVFLFFSSVSAALSGYLYHHYRQIIVPALLLPISFLFQYLENSETTKKEVVSILISLIVLWQVVAPDWLLLLRNFPTYYGGRHWRDENQQEFIIADQIRKNTDPTDEITVFGNWDVLYLMSKRSHATKYSYQFPIGQYDERIMDEYFASLEQNPPKIIVIEPKYKKDSGKMLDFIGKHDYELLWGVENSETMAVVYIMDEQTE